ncbi:hypothetical protein AB0F88_11805 [Streptosporangium sp. NPDC023963]
MSNTFVREYFGQAVGLLEGRAEAGPAEAKVPSLAVIGGVAEPSA